VSKLRTAFFQERENDEPMALQVNISGDLSANNMKYPYFIKLGAFFCNSTGVKIFDNSS
jgi:hypothetical protein